MRHKKASMIECHCLGRLLTLLDQDRVAKSARQYSPMIYAALRRSAGRAACAGGVYFLVGAIDRSDIGGKAFIEVTELWQYESSPSRPGSAMFFDPEFSLSATSPTVVSSRLSSRHDRYGESFSQDLVPLAL